MIRTSSYKIVEKATDAAGGVVNVPIACGDKVRAVNIILQAGIGGLTYSLNAIAVGQVNIMHGVMHTAALIGNERINITIEWPPPDMELQLRFVAVGYARVGTSLTTIED